MCCGEIAVKQRENTDRVRPSLLEQGYKNTSVSQIVDEAGVAKEAI